MAQRMRALQPLAAHGLHSAASRLLHSPPAALVPTLSMKFWDQDDPNELLGAHTFVPGAAAYYGAN